MPLRSLSNFANTWSLQTYILGISKIYVKFGIVIGLWLRVYLRDGHHNFHFDYKSKQVNMKPAGQPEQAGCGEYPNVVLCTCCCASLSVM